MRGRRPGPLDDGSGQGRVYIGAATRKQGAGGKKARLGSRVNGDLVLTVGCDLLGAWIRVRRSWIRQPSFSPTRKRLARGGAFGALFEAGGGPRSVADRLSAGRGPALADLRHDRIVRRLRRHRRLGRAPSRFSSAVRAIPSWNPVRTLAAGEPRRYRRCGHSGTTSSPSMGKPRAAPGTNAKGRKRCTRSAPTPPTPI